MEVVSKVNMETLPLRMRELPIDKRGYPVPWFVEWIDGEPEFRAMDRNKFVRAIKEKLCWVCGERLGVNVVFVAGPMCGINRTSSEPPSHIECARWSAVNCPFLSNPRMVRREDDLINNAKVVENTAGFALTRNPGVTMLWVTRTFETIRDPIKGGYLITMGEPERVEWFREGRTATRAEVQESIDTGMPALEGLARMESDGQGLTELRKYVARFDKWLPARTVSVP